MEHDHHHRNRRLRIWHVVREPQANISKSLLNLARAQRDAGHIVKLVILRSKNWAVPDWLYEFNHALIWSPNTFGTTAYLLHELMANFQSWLAHHAVKGSPLVVHYHDAWHAGALLSQSVRAEQIQVVTYYDISASTSINQQIALRALQRHWAKRVHKFADLITSVDSTAPSQARSLFGVAEDRFTVVQCGVNANPLAALVRRFGGRELVIGHIKGINDHQDWRVTAGAVDECRAQGLDVRLVVAGGGPERAMAQQWCAERPNYCEYLEGTNDLTSRLWPRIDALSLPSYTETSATTVMEALAGGVPVVATKVNCLVDVIRDGMEGFFIEPGVKSFAAAFMQLTSNRTLAERLSKQCQRRWKEKFSSDVMEMNYRQIYLSAFAQRRQSQALLADAVPIA